MDIKKRTLFISLFVLVVFFKGQVVGMANNSTLEDPFDKPFFTDPDGWENRRRPAYLGDTSKIDFFNNRAEILNRVKKHFEDQRAFFQKDGKNCR